MFSLGVIVCSLAALAAATDVQQCPGQSIPSLKESVQLVPCKKIPCKLKRGTNQNITIHFTPETDMNDVKNNVKADVLGVLLPFAGVDGASVCNNIEREDGEKASCPLKSGTKYVYKDSFPILSFYPTIPVEVHWSLQNKEKDIVCFKVSAKIV